MNPRIINAIIKGNEERLKRELDIANTKAYVQGMYFRDALLCTVGNMFKKKTSKPIEYPKKPYDFTHTSEEMTEEEIQKQRELFVAKLMAMKVNFDLNHKAKAEED